MRGLSSPASGLLPFSIEYPGPGSPDRQLHFHTDVFMMMSQLASAGQSERMVVEQVQELQGEKAAILGTRVGNLQSEAFDPLISRMYSIEAEAGAPTPPDVLLETIHSRRRGSVPGALGTGADPADQGAGRSRPA